MRTLTLCGMVSGFFKSILQEEPRHMHSRVPGPPWRLHWCTSRASWRQGRSWWVRLWKKRAQAPGWRRCSLQALCWSGGPGWGYHHHHHHHQDDHNRHSRHHRRYHHHLVARHVVMHQVRGIGMMQYITKMMKTKYLGGFSVMIQWFKSNDSQ